MRDEATPSRQRLGLCQQLTPLSQEGLAIPDGLVSFIAQALPPIREALKEGAAVADQGFKVALCCHRVLKHCDPLFEPRAGSFRCGQICAEPFQGTITSFEGVTTVEALLLLDLLQLPL